MVHENAAIAAPLLNRLIGLCRAALPDSTIIVHGSLALGDYMPGKSDLDVLVLSDAPTDGLVEAVQAEWKRRPTNLDLRVVAYDVAATPTRRAQACERDLEGRIGVFRDGARPDPAKVTAYVETLLKDDEPFRPGR